MSGNQSTGIWGGCQGATGSEEEVMREGQASRAQATGRTGRGQRLGEPRGWEAGRAAGVLGLEVWGILEGQSREARRR